MLKWSFCRLPSWLLSILPHPCSGTRVRREWAGKSVGAPNGFFCLLAPFQGDGMKVNPLLVLSQQNCGFILSSDVLHTEYFICNSQSFGQILKYAVCTYVGCSDDIFFFFFPPNVLNYSCRVLGSKQDYILKRWHQWSLELCKVTQKVLKCRTKSAHCS